MQHTHMIILVVDIKHYNVDEFIIFIQVKIRIQIDTLSLFRTQSEFKTRMNRKNILLFRI